MASEKKPVTASRRNFVRTRVPLAESVASLVILALMVVIGVAIAIKGRHFDPNLFAVRTDSLKSTIAPVVGKDQTAPSQAVVPPGGINTAPAVASKPIAEKSAGGEEGSPEGGVEGSAATSKVAV